MDLAFIRDGLAKNLHRIELNQTIFNIQGQIILKIQELLSTAQVKTEDVTTLFFTGGTTKIPSLRSAIVNLFKNAEIYEGDTFNAVANGLAIEAREKYS